MNRVAILAVGFALIIVTGAQAQVACNALVLPEPKTHYGFAKATLVSLWYARNGAERVSEMTPEAGDSEPSFSILTSMMRAIKTSTNDFVCAKRSVQSFNVKSSDEDTRTAAHFLALVYDQHIALNQRALELLRKLGSSDQANFMTKLADQISTLQVERDQRWADLKIPTTLALAKLIDMRPTDDKGNFIEDNELNRKQGKTLRLAITKEQKQTLLDWAGEHFSEFAKSPEVQWSAPAATAHAYIDFLSSGRKCSDE